ncbi:MAG: hypothetical protein QOK26_222 [Pseudonocardiales bacterium]|nr:hypothetical protein [Pseudonocardiales bacterium]
MVGAGEPADGSGAVYRDFTGRVGDPVPVIGTDGTARLGADLVALTVAGLLAHVAHGSAPAHLAIAHPAAWGRYELSVLHSALTTTAAGDVPISLVSAPVAAVAAAESAGAVHPGEAVLVADIGSGDTELAVLTDGADRPRLLVATSRVEDLGGAVLDRALAAYVLEQLRGRFAGLDQADPANHAALRELVARCRLARADLARRPATVVDVRLPGGEERVRVIRTELESLTAGPISAAVSAIARMSGESEAKGIPIAAVLLTGESARTPLLTEQLSARIRARVLVSPDAEWTAAVGAAGIAAARARRARSGPLTVTRPDNAVPKAPPHPAPLSSQPQKPRPQKPRPQNSQLPPGHTQPRHTPASHAQGEPTPNYPPASRGTSRIRTAVASAVAGFAVLIAGGVAVSGAGGGSGAHLASGTHDGHR